MAVRKLGSGHIFCPLFISYIEDALIELMNLSHSLVSVDKLYQLATQAGFEQEFLYNLGTNILPSEKSEDVEFWIGLAQKKLAKAIRRESVFWGHQTFQDKVSSVIHVLTSSPLSWKLLENSKIISFSIYQTMGVYSEGINQS